METRFSAWKDQPARWGQGEGERAELARWDQGEGERAELTLSSIYR
jgi:hypothetical protein